MRVFVTGGAGFIGSEYVRQLFEFRSHEIEEVTVFDKLTYAANLESLTVVQSKKNFHFIQGDISNPREVRKALRNHDVIVNFAAESHVDRSIDSPREFITTNVLGTEVLLEAALDLEITKFLQVSTDEVYGSIAEGAATESNTLNPSSPYSASKAAGELIALSFYKTFGLDVRITRSSNNYGPYQYPEKLIPFFVKRTLEGKKLPLYGNGLNIRNWIHVSDNCRGIHSVLIDGQPGEIFNIGGIFSSTNIDIAERILNYFGTGLKEIEYVADRKGHDFRYAIDSTKIQQEIGFEEEIDFSKGIIEAIEWQERNLKL